MNPLRRTARLVCIPQRLVVLTIEASRWRTRPGGDRASEEGFMGADFMEAGGMGAGGEGSSPSLFMKDTTQCIYGGKQLCTA
jgi:hypothetical protein